MPYKRKTRTEWEVQGYYDKATGWECVTGAETWKETREYLKEYRAAEPGIPFRGKRIRVKLTEECQNCGKRWTEDELLLPIPHLEERVSPGEPMPSGECPECRALCHTYGKAA
jgi:hypothetical protein